MFDPSINDIEIVFVSLSSGMYVQNFVLQQRVNEAVNIISDFICGVIYM